MNFTYAGIDHVQLAAPRGCEAAARQFFGELLGMAELVKPPALQARGGAWFACGAQQIHIGVEADFAPAKKAHPAFVVQNLDALIARLETRGVTYRIDTAIEERKRFFMDDPWGNRLEFMEEEGK
ncbi:VOC family protein [Tumebacillus lipolyticus]|uniref:VOC family protein n=1 Tax=Tumebacillus lipolyticus TaxID=1280370 RepID=A0ABW4ZWH5_9BACL